MVHLDTSILIDALTGSRRSAQALRKLMAGPEPVTINCIVLFEWLRGPRSTEELAAQEVLFPSAAAVLISSLEAQIAAALYKKVGKARGREADLMIAACAIAAGATLWTLNPKDFSDIPGLNLF